MHRFGWTVLIGIIAVALCATAFLYAVFVRGRQWTTPIGGEWEVRYRSTPGDHGGADATLWRRSGGRAAQVDELIFLTQYYGDDCVAYDTHRGLSPAYYAACGDREPVLIGTREFGTNDAGTRYRREYRIEPQGIVETTTTETGSVTTRVVPPADLKRRAAVQPPRREGWYRVPAQP